MQLASIQREVKMSRKAQVTIFLLLGIVILIVMGFLFYVRSQTITSVSQQNVQQTLDSVLASAPIKVYVESCLEQATTEALLLIGKQGGKIFDNQLEGTAKYYGLANTLPYEELNKDYYVGYGIFKSREDIPGYPYPGSLNPEDTSNAFGINGMIELCDNQGMNAWDLPNAQYSCIQYAPLGSDHSVQEYLQKFIEAETQECVDFETLSTELGYDLEQGKISVEVLFGDTDVLVNLDYEITISTHEKQTLTKLLEFSTNFQIRLKKIYELAYYAIEAETNNIFFDIADPVMLNALHTCPSADRLRFTDSCLKPGMEIKQLRDVCSICGYGANYTDIIQITDSASILEGQPYLFQFAVKNRAPTLDLIDWRVDDKAPYYWYLLNRYGIMFAPKNIYDKADSNCDSCNIAVKAGQVIEIYPYAIDPDGDSLEYNYYQWKSTFWEFPIMDATNHRDASLQTSNSDIGMHYVLVVANDNQGLHDYQNISIMVKAVP